MDLIINVMGSVEVFTLKVNTDITPPLSVTLISVHTYVVKSGKESDNNA